jgi:hypothetical protein
MDLLKTSAVVVGDRMLVLTCYPTAQPQFRHYRYLV